jgi:hypothetical protein
MINSLSKLNSNALKSAIIIGSFLFVINHGASFFKGEMTFHRWFSTSLGFVIPFATSVYCPCAQRTSKNRL